MNKSKLLKLSENINSYSLRERLFIFLTIIVILTASADVFIIEPAQLINSNQHKTFLNQEMSLRAARDKLHNINKSNTKNLSNAEIDSNNEKINDLKNEFNTLVKDKANTNTVSIEETLTKLMRQYKGLSIVSTISNEPQPQLNIENSDIQDNSYILKANIVKRNIKITVSGSYENLVLYTKLIEKTLPNLDWGPIELISIEKNKSELTLQLFMTEVIS